MARCWQAGGQNGEMKTTRHVALLGGINVGGHRVKMDRLCALVTSMGFANVTSYIASGNVLFDAPSGAEVDELAATIAAGLGAALGYAVPTYVRTDAEIAEVAALRPFGEVPDGCTHTVAFCSTPLASSLTEDHLSGDLWRVHGRELHWFIPGRLTSSPITLPKCVRQIGQPATTRNHTMVRKLAQQF
jgi:uncharacterized protein (DUF1697 family)